MRSQAASTVVSGLEGLSPSHRAVLESLLEGGPQTVPALARARPVARQHIQVLVNDLLRMELVETRENPAHRRSPHISVTPRGRRVFTEVRSEESRILKGIKFRLTAKEVRHIASQLEGLCGDIEAFLEA